MVDDHGGPDSDDLSPADLDSADLSPADALRSADSPEGADDAWVRGLLADLDFLRPEAYDAIGAADAAGTAGPSDEPMPPWVWARVGATLAAEAGTTRRRPAWVRWGGGLVAASVAVLAIGVAVTSFSGANNPTDTDSAVMAGAAPEAAAMKAGASPEAAVLKAAAPDTAAAPRLESPLMLSFAGMVPPALRLTGSQTDYTADNLAAEVTGLLQQMDMAPEKARVAMQQVPAELAVPDPEPPMLLQSPVMLRDCITKLTQIATSTALLIDWSTYQGAEAGVIVAPEYPTSGQPDVTELDVWVVDHRCTVQEIEHLSMR